LKVASAKIERQELPVQSINTFMCLPWLIE
jgi:hypothetical protein